MSEANEHRAPPGESTQGTATPTAKNQRKGANNQKSGRTSRTSQNGNGTAGFRGDTEEMTGHVFELPMKGNQYATTLTVLKRYASVTYDSGPAMASLFAS